MKLNDLFRTCNRVKKSRNYRIFYKKGLHLETSGQLPENLNFRSIKPNIDLPPNYKKLLE